MQSTTKMRASDQINASSLILCLGIALTFTAFQNVVEASMIKRSLKESSVECLDDGRFYRNPQTDKKKVFSFNECSKYFLCLDGEVFEFRCSAGLLFDVSRQICDYKANVDNCDVVAEQKVPKPLLKSAMCDENQLGCADGTCLPNEYFCDGSIDCPDGSDEGYCNPNDDPNAADVCDLSVCQLPDCFCSKDGTRIPGNLEPANTPQMIILTFDDAINMDNWGIYEKIFGAKRKNPNNCPIKSTFYVSHQYSQYDKIQRLWEQGHEIALHSITHRGPELFWRDNATIEDYFDEFVGQANIINKFGNVRMEELRGIRVPFLKVGWNRQFLMMKEFGFVYDSSIVAPFTNTPLWPYTLDYMMPHRCIGDNHCPSRSYQGIWELVLNQMEVEDGRTCVYVDQCPSNLNADDIYQMFMHNFKRHYYSSRAPFGLYFHASWFRRNDYMDIFQKFLAFLEKLPDVYFVTASQAIEWMKDPTPTSKIHSFKPWQCPEKDLEPHEKTCAYPNSCKLNSRVLQQDRYLMTCSPCPSQYPWIRNEFGLD